MKKLFISVAVLLAALTACQKEIDQPAEQLPATANLCTVSIQAAKAPITKALELDGKTIKATWAEGEVVAVYLGNTSTKIGTLSPTTFGNAATTLEGMIDVSGLSEGSELNLIYPGDVPFTYARQDGTLETISSRYDFATAKVKVESLDGENISTSEAGFTNVGAIIKFSLKNADGTEATPVERLTVSTWKSPIINECKASESGGWQNIYGPVTVVPTYAASDITAALCCVATDPGTFCLTGEASGKYYECVRDEALFAAGKYYTGTVKMQQVSYTVAGGPDAAFGKAWDPTFTANDMVFDEATALYKLTRTAIPKGTVLALKVVKNHSWDESVGGSYPGDNIYLTAWEEGDLNVTFNPASREVEAWIDYYVEPEEIPTVYTIVGDKMDIFGTQWYPADTNNDMEPNGDGTWSKTYNGVEAGEINFNVLQDRSWDNAVPASGYHYYYAIPGYGSITITFNPAAEETEKITVTYTASETPTATYTVAGSSEALFGSTWLASDTSNDMTQNEDGTFSISYTVTEAISSVEFKVVKNHNWTYCWPEGANNYVYTGITGPGTFTITFNPETGVITPSFEAGVIEVSYTIAGNSESLFGGEWDPSLTANDMVLQEDGTYRKVYDWVPAGTLEFKVVKNHAWGTAGIDDWPADGNYLCTLPIGGTLTIDFNPETKEITVARESTCTVVGEPLSIFGVTEWSIDASNDMTLNADGKYSITFTGVTAGVDVAFKIAINHSWNESYGELGSIDNFKYKTLNANDLTITFDPETKVITCYQDIIVSVVGTMNGWAFDGNYDMILREDGLYKLTIIRLGIGDYEYKIAYDHSWDVNYGLGGVPDGGNYTFSVSLACDVTFVYDPETHLSTVSGEYVTVPQS